MIPPLKRIREVLRRADIEGLIAIGAPKDEYDSEAQLIRQGLSETSLNATRDEGAAVAIIRDVWKQEFELDDGELDRRNEAFASAAREMLEH